VAASPEQAGRRSAAPLAGTAGLRPGLPRAASRDLRLHAFARNKIRDPRRVCERCVSTSLSVRRYLRATAPNWEPYRKVAPPTPGTCYRQVWNCRTTRQAGSGLTARYLPRAASKSGDVARYSFSSRASTSCHPQRLPIGEIPIACPIALRPLEDGRSSDNLQEPWLARDSQLQATGPAGDVQDREPEPQPRPHPARTIEDGASTYRNRTAPGLDHLA